MLAQRGAAAAQWLWLWLSTAVAPQPGPPARRLLRAPWHRAGRRHPAPQPRHRPKGSTDPDVVGDASWGGSEQPLVRQTPLSSQDPQPQTAEHTQSGTCCTFLAVGVINHQKGSSRPVVNSPLLEILKPSLDISLGTSLEAKAGQPQALHPAPTQILDQQLVLLLLTHEAPDVCLRSTRGMGSSCLWSSPGNTPLRAM